MGGSSPALTPDLLCDCCASLCPKHCRGGVLTTSSASTEAQETGRTPALTLETCLSCGRSLWGWESLRDKRESHLPNRFPSKVPPPPAPANPCLGAWDGSPPLGFPWTSSLSPFPPAALGGGGTGRGALVFLLGTQPYLSPTKCLHTVLVLQENGEVFLYK